VRTFCPQCGHQRQEYTHPGGFSFGVHTCILDAEGIRNIVRAEVARILNEKQGEVNV